MSAPDSWIRRRWAVALIVALAGFARDATPEADGAAASPPPLFVIQGAPTAQFEQALRDTARTARARLQEQWPRPLSSAPLQMIWFDDAAAMERVARRRVQGVLALADTRRDRVLLHGARLAAEGPSGIETTLVHELVHLEFARAGVERLPRWLEEGLAMMLAGENRWTDAWLLAADRVRGRAGEAAGLWDFWPDFPGGEERAYRVAYSMTTAYIHKEYGGGETGRRRLLERLLDPAQSARLLDALWAPAFQSRFYREWLQEGRWGAWLMFLTGPALLFGGVGAGLLVWGYWVKRRRGEETRKEWEEEGPYFSQPADEDDEDGEEDPDDAAWEEDEAPEAEGIYRDEYDDEEW